MKGLELCRRFFFEVGLPAIRTGLPECLPYLAAGPVAGSHCYGDDDDVSQDHGWGPGFAVWLSGDAHARFAEPLQSLLDTLPREHLGYGWRVQPAHTCRVHDLNTYTNYLVGRTSPPQAALDWLHIPEHALFEITHRPVLHDATGQVAGHFAAFKSYPEDVWKKRLSACLAWLWRWGVEYLPRAERRGELIAAAMDWCRFAEYAMKAGFLLNRSYAPYHKWLHREFLKLPSLAGRIAPLLQQGFENDTKRTAIAEEIIVEYIQAMSALGYQPVAVREEQLHIPEPARVLYGYARAVQQTIGDPAIRRLAIYTEVLSPPSAPTWGWFMAYRDLDR
jgi:hypothetical protein